MSDNITQKYISVEIQNKYNHSPFRIPIRNREGIIIEFSLVDEDDYEKVNKYKWSLSKGKYAIGKIKNTTYGLHRFIFYGLVQNNKIIDHINRDSLDNRKCNLREVTHSENSQNRLMKNKKSTSKYIGVSISHNKFKVACVQKHLGYYEDEIEAAKKYDIYTYQIFGKHALNNRLIKFEDAIKLPNDDTIYNLRSPKFMENNLPQGVYYIKNIQTFRAQKQFRKNMYTGEHRKTVKEAYDDIMEINIKINKLKLIDDIKNYFREITRDDDGIAYILVNNTKQLIDEDLWHRFSLMKWTINQDGYATNGKSGFIHRIVTNAKKDELVDHINNNKNDNRLMNLRIATASQNSHNKLKQVGRSSKYIGVCFHKRDKIWNAYITHEKKRYSLGYYENEIDAAKAYNKKALELFSEFANLNQL